MIQQQLAKAFLYGVLIIGGGVLVVEATAPSRDDFIKRLPPGQAEEIEANKSRREREIEMMYKIVQENARSNRPVWDIRYDAAMEYPSDIRQRILPRSEVYKPVKQPSSSSSSSSEPSSSMSSGENN